MAIALNGEIVHSCDTATDFQTLNTGVNISGDDDIVEGAGAAGDKISNSTDECVVDAFEGATTTFDFSSGGTHEGWHGIGWINTKTPINATSGIQAYARNNAGHFGYINAMPSYFYKGGFTTRVWNPSADFTAATTWTTGGNPAQLDDVTGFGFRFTTTTSIMGSFNNVQVDQFTFGLGVRADVGTSGTPNTYQDVVDQDQDTSFWGWFSSLGAKGGLYIGPATGTTASWFVDSGFAIKFVDENVASGFYGIFVRGANTTCEFTLANISAENPTLSRWSLILDSAMGSTTGGFVDVNGVYSGSDQITLNQYASMTGTTIIDGTKMTQNDCPLDGISVIAPVGVTNEAYLLCNDPDGVTNSEFNFNTAGHGVEIDTAGTYTWDGNTFVGAYGGTGGTNLTPSSGSADAMILNSSGGLVTLNLINGATVPSIRNTAVSTTQVNASVSVSLAGYSRGTAVKLIANETLGGVTAGDVLAEGFADATGKITYSHNDEGSLDVIVRGRNQGIAIAAMAEDGGVFVDETAEASSNVTADMTLLPATPVANDAYNFGHDEEFTRLKLDISTALAFSGQPTIVWEYWNGAWVALSGVVDGTSGFENAGSNIVSWTAPGDWVARSLTNQENVGNLFYVRARLSVLGTITTVPVGRKVSLDVSRYLPYDENREILTGVGLSDSASWRPDTIAKFDPND